MEECFSIDYNICQSSFWKFLLTNLGKVTIFEEKDNLKLSKYHLLYLKMLAIPTKILSIPLKCHALFATWNLLLGFILTVNIESCVYSVQNIILFQLCRPNKDPGVQWHHVKLPFCNRVSPFSINLTKKQKLSGRLKRKESI